MRRIDRYLLKEMIVPATIGGVMVLMLLAGNQLFLLIRSLYMGVPVSDVFLTLLYYLPGMLILCIPAAMLVGTALSLNRLERDRELLAIRMAGVRLKRIVAPFILVAILASGGMFYLQEKVIPVTTREALKLTQKLMYGATVAVVTGDTVYKLSGGGKTYFVYVRAVNPDPEKQMLEDVLIIMQGGDDPMWMTVPVAENDNGHWRLHADPLTNEPPRVYAIPRKGSPWIMDVQGDENLLPIPKDKIFNEIAEPQRTPEELTFSELLHAYKSNSRSASMYNFPNTMPLDAQHLTFFLHRKLAAPLSALVAVLIAIPLSVHFGRSGGYVGLLLSVVVSFCFVITQQWTQVLADTGRMQPILAAWAPNIVYGLIGIILLFREE